MHKRKSIINFNINQMESQLMAKKRTDIPPELLSKEFLKQFKTEEDVSKFLKDLHSQVLEQMLQGEMDAHLGYTKRMMFPGIIPAIQGMAIPQK